jgi:taurine dioxygenase
MPEFANDDWIRDGGFSWRRLFPFGVELDHDFSTPLTQRDAVRFVELLWAHGLVLARGQELSMERQREICRHAGPVLLRPGENGYLNNEGALSQSELSWHSDAAYTNAPFDALSLHAIDVIDDASSTFFVNAQDRLDAMPQALRTRLEGCELDMISPAYEALALRTCDQRDHAAQKRSVQPAIRCNPHNGRECLWTSELQTASILQMDWEESRTLLGAVFEHLYQPAHVLEHRWRNGDLIIWDNIALQHRRGSLRACGRRVLQRVIVGTEGVAPHVNLDDSLGVAATP